MRRITVEEVLEAYRVTGMKPMRRYTIIRNQCAGCAIGALAVASGVPSELDCIYDWRDKMFGASYVKGFMNSFDDTPPSMSNEQYNQGYADGQAVAAAVFQEGAK